MKTTMSFSQLTIHNNDLHYQRGRAVVDATRARREYGIRSPVFATAWAAVERLTDKIAEAERLLAEPQKPGKEYEVEA